MRQSSISRKVAIVSCVFIWVAAWGQNYKAISDSGNGSNLVHDSIHFLEPTLIGVYRADGTFSSLTETTHGDPRRKSGFSNDPDQIVVPPSVHLRAREGIVQNLVPPAHASEPVRGRSLLAVLGDGIVTFAYGNEKVLRQPTHVTTDSRQRLIVSDPEAATVHVIDENRKGSFRISGGPEQRLRSPGAVAVDGKDNIYVADSKLGVIDVFDPGGHFLRYLGSVKGESMFDSPTAIAIHRKSGRLYVLDANADELIVLDLQGKVLKRVGREHSQTSVRLRHPSEIAIARDEVVVLDRFGSRIQTLDLDCNSKNSFALRNENGPPVLTEVGLALDSHLQIYISNLLSSAVRVYSHDGEFLGFMGRSSAGQDFNRPLGIWVDPSDRLYVSDSNNSRIQVFQLANGETAVPAARN